MKKKYEKPMVAISLFELQQNIAAPCPGYNPDSTLGKPSNSDKNSCGWDMNNIIIWQQKPACSRLYPDFPIDGGVCYNNPGGGINIFGAS